MGESEASGGASQRLFEARLAEHVQARQEMTSAISNQHLVLTFGSASIVGVFVAGFLVWEQSADPAVFLSVPFISAWVLAMWLAEVVRMLRAVRFCRGQEQLVNALVGVGDPAAPPLRWESWRAGDDERTITWTYVSVVAVLAGAYLTGLGFAMVVACWAGWVKAIVLATMVLALLLYLRWVLALASKWLDDVGAPQWLLRLLRLPGQEPAP
jgi:hypothetical protein